MVPPMKQLHSVGSGGYDNPFASTALEKSRRTTPASALPLPLSSGCFSIFLILFNERVERTTPPNGTRPPTIPVPPPEIVTGERRALASRRISAISAALFGYVTASANP